MRKTKGKEGKTGGRGKSEKGKERKGRMEVKKR